MLSWGVLVFIDLTFSACLALAIKKRCKVVIQSFLPVTGKLFDYLSWSSVVF